MKDDKDMTLSEWIASKTKKYKRRSFSGWDYDAMFDTDSEPEVTHKHPSTAKYKQKLISKDPIYLGKPIINECGLFYPFEENEKNYWLTNQGNMRSNT